MKQKTQVQKNTWVARRSWKKLEQTGNADFKEKKWSYLISSKVSKNKTKSLEPPVTAAALPDRAPAELYGWVWYVFHLRRCAVCNMT